jgi:hypothetical protein
MRSSAATPTMLAKAVCRDAGFNESFTAGSEASGEAFEVGREALKALSVEALKALSVAGGPPGGDTCAPRWAWESNCSDDKVLATGPAVHVSSLCFGASQLPFHEAHAGPSLDHLYPSEADAPPMCDSAPSIQGQGELAHLGIDLFALD